MDTSRIAGMLLALTLTAPLTAVAASGGNKPAFKDADANGDGKVAVQEATKAGVPKPEAKREDIDNNGKLTKTDWNFVDMNPSQQSGSGSGSGSSSS